jgi:hypothetical protein
VAVNAAAEVVGLGVTGLGAALLIMNAEGLAAWALMALMVAGGILVEGLVIAAGDRISQFRPD